MGNIQNGDSNSFLVITDLTEFSEPQALAPHFYISAPPWSTKEKAMPSPRLWVLNGLG